MDCGSTLLNGDRDRMWRRYVYSTRTERRQRDCCTAFEARRVEQFRAVPSVCTGVPLGRASTARAHGRAPLSNTSVKLAGQLDSLHFFEID